jgi:hypothetical protein
MFSLLAAKSLIQRMKYIIIIISVILLVIMFIWNISGNSFLEGFKSFLRGIMLIISAFTFGIMLNSPGEII